MKTLIILILICISILLFIFWCFQFLKLMRMKPEDFPAREDKVIWAVAMMLLNTVGAFLFWFQFSERAEKQPQKGTGQYEAIGEELYEATKDKFPDHLKEISLAQKLDVYRRCDLEKWYFKKSESDLITHYKNGSNEIDLACYGILLVILVYKDIELTSS